MHHSPGAGTLCEIVCIEIVVVNFGIIAMYSLAAMMFNSGDKEWRSTQNTTVLGNIRAAAPNSCN